MWSRFILISTQSHFVKKRHDLGMRVSILAYQVTGGYTIIEHALVIYHMSVKVCNMAAIVPLGLMAPYITLWIWIIYSAAVLCGL